MQPAWSLRLKGVLVALLLPLTTTAAHAEPGVATLRLSGWSYIRFGEEELLSLPPGTTIPFEIVSVAGDVATVRVPDGYPFPSLPYGISGKHVKYHVVGAALGAIQRTAGGLVVGITATIRAENPSNIDDGCNYTTGPAHDLHPFYRVHGERPRT